VFLCAVIGDEADVRVIVVVLVDGDDDSTIIIVVVIIITVTIVIDFVFTGGCHCIILLAFCRAGSFVVPLYVLSVLITSISMSMSMSMSTLTSIVVGATVAMVMTILLFRWLLSIRIFVVYMQYVLSLKSLIFEDTSGTIRE